MDEGVEKSVEGGETAWRQFNGEPPRDWHDTVMEDV